MPRPSIPEYLIPDTKKITATLLGGIEVEYLLEEKKNYIPGSYQVTNMHFIYKNRNEADTAADYVSGKIAEDIREQKIAKIEITLA